MASLKCSNCGEAIHYHDEADGTQYILFRRDNWNRLMQSDINISRYLLDGTNEYYTVWKCPACGTIHLFLGDNAFLESAYAPVELHNEQVNDDTGDAYIAFVDTLWDQITEPQIKGDELKSFFPDLEPVLLSMSEELIMVYKDGYISRPIRYYHRVGT